MEQQICAAFSFTSRRTEKSGPLQSWGVGPGRVIFHRQPGLPQQCDSRWQITWLMIEIWQNNTMFYNSVPKQKYGSRKLNSASSPPCQSQRFSIKGQIIVFCLPPRPSWPPKWQARLAAMTLKNICTDRATNHMPTSFKTQYSLNVHLLYSR